MGLSSFFRVDYNRNECFPFVDVNEIAEQLPEYTKLAGVTFENRQQYIPMLSPGEELTLRRDRFNKFDRNAIAVFDRRGHSLGFIPRQKAAQMAPNMDNCFGCDYKATVAEVTDGGDFTYGVNVRIVRYYSK